MVDEAQEAAQKARDNPNLPPLVKGPQEYLTVDAVVPATADFGPGERAAWVKQSVDICEKKGVLGSGYIPKALPDDLPGELRRAVRVLPVRRNRLHPHLPHGDRRRLGLVRHHRREGPVAGRRRRADRSRREQGAEESEAARDRAGPLHDDHRAAADGAPPVDDDGRVQRGRRRRRVRRRRWRRRVQLRRHRPAVRERRRHAEDRSEAVQRQLHAEERHRQSDPAADADHERRLAGQAGHVDREGRAEEPVLRSPRPRGGRRLRRPPPTRT